MSFIRSALLIVVAFSFSNCVSTRGGDQKSIGLGLQEVMVWDGKICDNVNVDKEQCKKDLMPMMNKQIEIACQGKKPKSVKGCVVNPKPTGTRLLCQVEC